MERGAKIGPVFRGGFRQKITDGGFQSAETEIGVAGIQHAPRQGEARWIAIPGAALDLRPARVGEPEHFAHLVESLPGGIVNRPADDLVLADTIDQDEQGVASAHDERNVRRDLAVPTEERRKQMSFEMVDREIRFAEAQGEALGEGGANHERAGQTRSARGGEGRDLA